MDKAALFTSYNLAKGLVDDRDRLDRALGICQRKAAPEYITTPVSCTCPDHTFRGRTCKHQLALMLTAASR